MLKKSVVQLCRLHAGKQILKRKTKMKKQFVSKTLVQTTMFSENGFQ